MKRMNLLPADYKEHTRFIRMVKIQIVLFVAVLIVLTASILLPASILKERRDWLYQLEQQAGDVGFVQAEWGAENILLLESERQAAEAILQELRGIQAVDIGVYEDITALLPDGAVVKNFQLTSGLCHVGGQAQSRADIVGFIGMVEGLAYIHEVQIRFMGLEKEVDPVDFSIEIYLKTEEDLDEGDTGY